MDDMLRESLAGFDSLWQRVTGRAEEMPDGCPADRGAPGGEAVLSGLIREEVCAAVWSAALARMFSGGEGRTVLMRHAADARQHVRRLRAERFIAAGVTDGPDEDCRPLTGRLTALRTVYLQAGELAARYDAAAEHANCGELREALATFADDERRRARELRALLIASFK